MNMSYVIAVAGKGGVGKSTLSALLVRSLSELTGEIVLAVDADPNANLGDKLGVKVERTIGQLREDLLKQADDLPAGMSKQDAVMYHLRLAMVEGEKFDLVTMGRQEGRGCYCYINNLLRTFLDGIMDDYRYVVIDNEAGMETPVPADMPEDGHVGDSHRPHRRGPHHRPAHPGAGNGDGSGLLPQHAGGEPCQG